MRVDWTESKLEFDFSTSLQTCQPDQEAAPLTTLAPPLKSVDFYVWHPEALWLIEVKDPDGAPLAISAGKEFWSQLKNDSLLKEHFLPKLYGAFVHLAIENVDIGGPVRYAIVIGQESLTNADRNMLTDKIERVVQKVGPCLRDGQHRPLVEIHNMESWNQMHPNMSVQRLL